MKTLTKISSASLSLLFLMGCAPGAPQPQPEVPVVQVPGDQEPREIPEVCLDFPENADLIRDDFKLLPSGEGVGKVYLTGKIISQQQERMGEQVKRVYIIVNKPNIVGALETFYDYYEEQSGAPVVGIPVNTIAFPLGIIKNNTLSTTADVLPETRAIIMNALEKKTPTSLTVRIPKYKASGVPANFTPACVLE
ncbi:hypothetical protein KBD59_01455 [Candidatus Gracilibacteria bacterium]|nr:hypothetical protein [Candidatus Gracilibacteria bacterium]